MSTGSWDCQTENRRDAPTRQRFCALTGDIVRRLLQRVSGGWDGWGADAVCRHIRRVVGGAVILWVLALRKAWIWRIFLWGKKNHLTSVYLVLSYKWVRYHKGSVIYACSKSWFRNISLKNHVSFTYEITFLLLPNILLFYYD